MSRRAKFLTNYFVPFCIFDFIRRRSILKRSSCRIEALREGRTSLLWVWGFYWVCSGGMLLFGPQAQETAPVIRQGAALGHVLLVVCGLPPPKRTSFSIFSWFSSRFLSFVDYNDLGLSSIRTRNPNLIQKQRVRNLRLLFPPKQVPHARMPRFPLILWAFFLKGYQENQVRSSIGRQTKLSVPYPEPQNTATQCLRSTFGAGTPETRPAPHWSFWSLQMIRTHTTFTDSHRSSTHIKASQFYMLHLFLSLCCKTFVWQLSELGIDAFFDSIWWIRISFLAH